MPPELAQLFREIQTSPRSAWPGLMLQRLTPAGVKYLTAHGITATVTQLGGTTEDAKTLLTELRASPMHRAIPAGVLR